MLIVSTIPAENILLVKMIVLGVDPGLIKTGYGVIKVEKNTLFYIASGTIFTNVKLPMADRLKNIFGEINNVINLYNPDFFSIEETFVNKNPTSSLKLGQARGVAILAAGMNNLKVFEYKPNAIKKSITGVGKAAKEQIGMMIKCLLPSANAKTEDEADALAIAICHANNSTVY
ncbi:MAG: crossover junction endodeoxyribonuclease RuvC [Rickettsiales bacterium]|jgi:crossover junction endodeoxyribonuclease RuvC|nr:crossover junction endodeoxyribonuclease RuvC [Rickettsiales bacterium]